MSAAKESVPDLIPVRMLVQYAYCKRLAYMEWVQGEFDTNAEVVDGTRKHRNVDKPSRRTKPVRDADDDPNEIIHARSVMISDEEMGMISKMDLLEIDGDVATPVEYKRGRTPQTPTNTYLDHVVQVCAQGLLLRANGYVCTGGIIYYVDSKQRVRVDFDDQTVAMTLQLISEMREMARKDCMPPPLVDSPKCPRCSLVGICLPDETNLLGGGDDEERRITKDRVRRMYPMRDDAVPVYVQEQGARVAKSGDCIHVQAAEETRKIRLIDVSELTVFGNVQITTQAIRALCERNIPICYMTYGGWFTGMTRGLASKNIELRIGQHATYARDGSRMAIAREIVSGKVKNSITMLRRNHDSPPTDKISEMEGLAKRALSARRYETLLGIEGMAARLYFSEFNGMLRTNLATFDFAGRNRRPPRDPVNAILSFLYAMLTRQATVTASAVGLDPYLGYLHRPKHGKPALALDLIEEFRPLVADSACLTLINTGEIAESDVMQTDFGVNLSAEGRKTVIRAYERRMDASVMHPLLGYKASYRRILETQARLLARHILGEIPSYPPFRTR